ncbi:endonuclease domain-containing protein [Dactylosporangium sp. CA-152071]|uniref:endonuclease domain-containing protein n=1 Tax=Dactylosporangium sp. CA-152071 TaxID=3239933 RepID=UPI003D8A911C
MERGLTGARWWEVPPLSQVSFLDGADPELLAVDLDPLPGGAPAVAQFRPGGALTDPVAVILAELDRAAMALFPVWLPGAERLEGPQGHGAAAVRALAAEVAARSRTFGPFLADLAERALRGRSGDQPRFAAEVRAAGLARVFADTYGRDGAALLVHVPAGLDPPAQAALTQAAEWFARHGRFGVWLAGAPLPAVDRIRHVRFALPPRLSELAAAAALVERHHEPGRPEPMLTFPPLSGRPRSDSTAETALERALAPHAWAAGRRWNHTYEGHLLGQLYRLDLFWPDDGVVVEVDGPEHRQPPRFADDRQRDVHLQLLGHDVLRFTNDQVLADVGAVVAKLRQLLNLRRSVKERIAHAEH